MDVLSLPCVEWERDWCRQSFSCVLQTWVQVSSIHILLDGNVGISAIRFFGFPRYFGSCILAEAQSAPQQCTGWEHPFLNTASFCSAFLMWDSLSQTLEIINPKHTTRTWTWHSTWNLNHLLVKLCWFWFLKMHITYIYISS